MNKTFFTENHEWIKVEGSEALIGITDYAQNELGDITFIDLPRAGTEVDQHDAVCVIESIKTAYEVSSPLSGVIIDVNRKLSNKPELVSEEPMDGGWLFKLGRINPKEFSSLIDKARYEEMLKTMR